MDEKDGIKYEVRCDCSIEDEIASFTLKWIKDDEVVDKEEFKHDYDNGLIDENTTATNYTPEEKTRALVIGDSLEERFGRFDDY